MSRKLILITFLTSLAASPAYAIDARINGESKYGCTSKEYYDKTVEMVAQNDREAFAQVLGSGIAAGICTMFKAGESVVISDNGLFMLKVRRKGNPTEYWISGDSITR